MEHKSRFRENEDQAQAGEHTHQNVSAASAAEFDSPEALLRHDAARTPVPPHLAHRLSDSLNDQPPPPPSSWWRRLLGG